MVIPRRAFSAVFAALLDEESFRAFKSMTVFLVLKDSSLRSE
jgi:hypothetical protein